MTSCEAGIQLGALWGAGAGVIAALLFILAAKRPVGASLRRHLLWVVAFAAAWGIYGAGADVAACYATGMATAAAAIIGLAVVVYLIAVSRQIGSRSIK
jgi:hypothetical protein